MTAGVGVRPATDQGWRGQWVSDHLGVVLQPDPVDGAGGGLTLPDLVGMALRVNPRRAHLLVSTVLGKHIPTDPRIVYGSGRLLGAQVVERLDASDAASGVAEAGGRLLRAALSSSRSAAADLVSLCDEHLDRRGNGSADGASADVVVLGYAETATALGHCVADSLGARYLHSTRRPVPGVADVGGFEEEHSHATSHLLLPEDADLLGGGGPLVLVDDELSTGQTVLNTIAALQPRYPRRRYLVAALIDLRTPADRERMAAEAARHSVRLDVVTLASGQLDLPSDVLARGRRLVAAHARPVGPPAPPTAPPARSAASWPAGVRDGARHGFTAADRAPFDTAVDSVARTLSAELCDGADPAGASRARRVLVLGTEELMYLPLRVAVRLAELDTGLRLNLMFGTTTRSPAQPIDEPGYAIRTALGFDRADGMADGPDDRYAYNVAPRAEAEPFDEIVVITDAAATGDVGGLAAALAGTGAAVRVVHIPSYRPEPC